MPLQHTYRPGNWKQVIGNKVVVGALQSAVTRNTDKPHAYLITGPAGCGKTSLSRIIAKELGASGLDFIELNAADFRGIDMVRELRNKSRLKPMSGKVRVWLLDEVHQLSTDAQEAALKLLEEPPEHAYFVLATTEPQKLKPTLIRRCHHSELKALKNSEIVNMLAAIWKKEMEGEPAPDKVLQHIAEVSLGSPGQALAVLDRVIEVEPSAMLKVVDSAAAQVNQSIELCRLLIKRSPWKKISDCIKGLMKEDAERVRQHVMSYAMSCLLGRDDAQAALILVTLRDNHSGFGVQWPALVASFYEISAT